MNNTHTTLDEIAVPTGTPVEEDPYAVLAEVEPKATPAQPDKPKMYMREAMFVAVRDNPGIRLSAIAARLRELGYGSSADNASAQLRQLVRRGLLQKMESTGEYWARVQAYPVDKRYANKPASAKPKHRPKAQAKDNAQPAVAPAPPAPRGTGIAALIDTLTIAEAREIYGVLHKLFG